MAKGNYIVSANADNTELIFSLAPDADADLPLDQQDLIFDAGTILESIRILYAADRASFSGYFQQLLAACQLGLVGPMAQPQLAKRTLEHIKLEITNREAGKVKNKYLRKLGTKAAWMGIPFFIAGVLINYIHRHVFVPRGIYQDVLDTASLFLVWSGTMIGVWLSFAITRTTIAFDDLTIIEKDRLEPAVRLFFTGSLGIIFALFFIKNAISIKLGTLSSDHLLKDPVTAFLIGVILGLNEKLIGSSLTKKTSALLG